MINNRKLLEKLQNKTNRETFIIVKEFLIKFPNINISDNEIYQILIETNGFKSYTNLVINFDKKLANPMYFVKLMLKIISGIPIQYALGYSYFLDIKLLLNKNTLIPRIETEGLVLLTKQIIEKFNLSHSTIIDCCAGSGAIGLMLERYFKGSKVYFIEKYSRTIKMLNKNLKFNDSKGVVLKGDKVFPLLKRNIKADVFVSNPPYVSNICDIEARVLKNEPIHAIVAKNDTEFYENYFKYHDKFMNKEFLMIFEIGYDQKERIKVLIEKYFDINVVKYEFENDLYNLTRYLYIYKI